MKLISIIFISLQIKLVLEQQSGSISSNLGMFYTETKKKIESLLKQNPQLASSHYLKLYYIDSSSNSDRVKESYEYLFEYSSRSKNDLSGYYQCVRSTKSQINKYTYLIIQFDTKNNKDFYYPNTITYGLCLVYEITLFNNESTQYTDTIKELINAINIQSDYAFIPKDISFTVINVNEYQNSSNAWYEILTLIIGFSFTTVLILFNVFNKIPEFLFKQCIKKQRSSVISKETKSKLYRYVSCFNLTENSEELFRNNLNTVIYNDTGLSYAKGINSICLIIYLFGLTYMRLFQSSTLMFQEHQYNNALIDFRMPLFSFGVRFCPRIIFSCSGFTFIYKILCFFEEESKRNKDDKEELKSKLNKSGKNKVNDNNNTKLDHSLDTLIKKGILLESKEKDLSKIYYSSLFIFIIKQSHRFINALFTMLIFRTISIVMKPLAVFCSSLAIVYKNSLGQITFEDIFGHFFFYKTFYIFEGSISLMKQEHCCMRFIWLFINEAFFFLVSSPLIFLCCKFKIAFNRVILILIALFIIFRYLIYYLVLQSSTQYEKATNTLNDYSPYNSFAINPLYNYPDFLIGIFFGLMNYVLQKDITGENDDDEQQKDPLFALSSNIVYYFKYQYKIILYFLVVLFIGLICVITMIQILFYYAVSQNFSDFYYNEIINAFYLIDIEIVIVLIHTLMFSIYAKGGNAFTQIMSNKSWIKFNKLYFSVITSINMYLLLIIHQSETMISLEIFSFWFYGIITFAIMLFFGYINCIFNEFPLKRLSKLLINEFRNGNTDKIDDD